MTTRPLITLPMPAGAGVLDLIPHLRAALDGSGPAVAPYAASDAPPPGLPGSVPDAVAVVVGTSGTTGRSKRAALSAAALNASAQATARALGGHAAWLLALPAQHIAGLQVILRSLIAGHEPIVMPAEHFAADAFVAATARLAGAPRRHTSLVPAQLARLLDVPAAADALATYDAVLVGGAATPPELAQRASAAGIALVRTYGSSETCGGCVYDGHPLPGVQVELDDTGRVMLAGPVLMEGYLRDDGGIDPVGPHFGTDDLGSWVQGRLEILGRVDDLINTAGYKVAPQVVEAALRGLDGVRDALVVAVPDATWGEAVGALIVISGEGAGDQAEGQVGDQINGDASSLRESVRARLRDILPRHALPQRVVAVEAIPTRGIGKPDRAAARALLSEPADRL